MTPIRPAPAGLDRVVRVEHGREAVGVRAVPATLDILDSHFPRFPVLPGVLLVHAMAQLGAVALGDADEWVLDGAEAIRFRHAVRPGDVAVVTTRVADGGLDVATCTATVSVDGRVVATARRLYLTRVRALSPGYPREGALA